MLNSAARCALAANRIEEAEALARDALQRDPDFLPSLLTLGQAADARGEKDVADRYYAECLEKAKMKGTPPPKVTEEIQRRAEEYLNRRSSSDRRP